MVSGGDSNVSATNICFKLLVLELPGKKVLKRDKDLKQNPEKFPHVMSRQKWKNHPNRGKQVEENEESNHLAVCHKKEKSFFMGMVIMLNEITNQRKKYHMISLIGGF